MARLVNDIHQLLSHRVNAIVTTEQTHPLRDSHHTVSPQFNFISIFVHFSLVFSIFSCYSTPFNRKLKRKYSSQLAYRLLQKHPFILSKPATC